MIINYSEITKEQTTLADVKVGQTFMFNDVPYLRIKRNSTYSFSEVMEKGISSGERILAIRLDDDSLVYFSTLDRDCTIVEANLTIKK